MNRPEYIGPCPAFRRRGTPRPLAGAHLPTYRDVLSAARDYRKHGDSLGLAVIRAYEAAYELWNGRGPGPLYFNPEDDV